MELLNSPILPLVFAPFIGSFLGVVVLRTEHPGSIVTGRSCCDECGARLSPLELVPVVSWLALRGRCRHCGKPIGIFHPLMELAAVAVVMSAMVTVSGWLLWLSALFGWVLLALAMTDFKYFLLPDFLTLPLIAVGLLVTWLIDPPALAVHAAGAAAGYLMVVVLRAAYRLVRHREGMGLGDAKLLTAAGAWVSLEGLPSVILFASLTGLVFALLVSLRKGSISLADRVPFGAFLAFGAWIVWLNGPLVFE